MSRRTYMKAALLLLGVAALGTALYFVVGASRSLDLPHPVERPQGYVSQVGRKDINLGKLPPQTDGTHLLFRPRKDLEPWPLQLPLDWDANPYKDENWRFQLHAWRMMDPLLAGYFESRTENLHRAFAFALDWFAYHYEQGRNSTMAWYDMAAGIRAMKLALFLDRYYAGRLDLSRDETRRLLALVDEHARRLQDESFISESNHGLFQVFGLELLCRVAADRESCANGRDFASRMFSKILKAQYTEEGVHREHSPFYHGFAWRTIERLGGTKRFDDPVVASVLARAAKIQPWFIAPDGSMVAVGDTAGRGKPLAVARDAPPKAADFTKSGYAIIRDHDSMLFVTGMAYSLTHKHADDLSFVLFEHGRPLFIDSGKYGYNTDPMRRYVESAAAHNTISLLGREIAPADVTMTGSSLRALAREGDAFVVTGQIERPGASKTDTFTQAREIRYVPGRSLMIRDELSASSEQIFVSSLHLARDLRPDLVEGGFDVTLPTGRKVRARLSEPDCTIETMRGRQNPPLGWESVGYLKMEPTSVVRAVCGGRKRAITWTVALD
ncbi:alginate lyase family protein [Microvirga makkahensis]|uniref:Heparin-sulfate lyase N-terminal domain-containing protein n=1 Tax=Microvirga makkahensis TaxID=1128670 RepID=A0A7X3SNG1_9HYPH|nr:alginate lyase family protein [Microvirga makkahensis]MXQ11163.1 hypothetical protein [Microvirga makkahensis]